MRFRERSPRYAYGDNAISDRNPLQRNPWLTALPSRHGIGRDDFPCLPSMAPFLWQYLNTTYEMDFVGGLMGIAHDSATLSLRPEIGGAVRAV